MHDHLNLRKKLLYISTHRGTKEGDLMMGGFAQKYIFQLTPQDIQEYSKILDYPDATIFEWVKYPERIPEGIKSQLVDRLRHFIFIERRKESEGHLGNSAG